MENKEIIIDGVDVSGCPNFTFNKIEPNESICISEQSAMCVNNKDCLYKRWKRKEQECEELKQYKYLFEKTRNLWNESRMNNYKFLDEIKDLKDSLKRTICQSECYKHKEADKLKKTLTEIKEIAEKTLNMVDYKTYFKRDNKSLKQEGFKALNEILQKISEGEVENE